MDPKAISSLEKFQMQGLTESLERTLHLTPSTRNAALLTNGSLSCGTQAASGNPGWNRMWPHPKLKGPRCFSPPTAPCWRAASDPRQPRNPPPHGPGLHPQGHRLAPWRSPGPGRLCGVLSRSVVFDSLQPHGIF